MSQDRSTAVIDSLLYLTWLRNLAKNVLCVSHCPVGRVFAVLVSHEAGTVLDVTDLFDRVVSLRLMIALDAAAYSD